MNCVVFGHFNGLLHDFDLIWTPKMYALLIFKERLTEIILTIRA